MMSKYHYTNDADTRAVVNNNYQLKLFIDSDNQELKHKYAEQVKQHNVMVEDNPYPDSGFDLYCDPNLHFKFMDNGCSNHSVSSSSSTSLYAGDIIKFDFGVKASMTEIYTYDDASTLEEPVGFYMYPRSSTGSKTPLRLSNSVGIIDSGYRGNLMSVFDVLYDYTIDIKYARYIQLCAPDLKQFEVKIVDSVDELGLSDRGDGGFGSTGK